MNLNYFSQLDNSYLKKYDWFMKTKTLNASQARADFYNLLKKVSSGKLLVKIAHQGNDDVVLMSENDYLAWQETLDILLNKKELQQLKLAIADNIEISHNDALAKLGIENEDLL